MSDTAIQVLERLREGNQRFQNGNLRQARDDQGVVVRKATPVASVLGCVDSRVAPEFVFDQSPGDLMTARVAGNVLTEDVLGSLEIACAVAGTRLLVVLGHSDCVAVRYACEGTELGTTEALLSKLRPAIDATEHPVDPSQRNGKNDEFVTAVSRCNADLGARAVISRSEVLADLQARGELMVVSAFYDTESGAVEFQQ